MSKIIARSRSDFWTAFIVEGSFYLNARDPQTLATVSIALGADEAHVFSGDPISACVLARALASNASRYHDRVLPTPAAGGAGEPEAHERPYVARDAVSAEDNVPFASSELRHRRYTALREKMPHLFAGGGPITLLAPESNSKAGVVYADRWRTLLMDAVEFPDGKTGTYTRLLASSGAHGVAVLPLTEDGQVVLLRHWRHATQDWHLEIPRGFGEPDKSDEDQAAAELHEELGLVGQITAVGMTYPDTGTQSDRAALFVAQIPSGQVPAHNEGLATVVTMTISEFEDAIADGRVNDPFAIIAWTRHSLAQRRVQAAVLLPIEVPDEKAALAAMVGGAVGFIPAPACESDAQTVTTLAFDTSAPLV